VFCGFDVDADDMRNGPTDDTCRDDVSTASEGKVACATFVGMGANAAVEHPMMATRQRERIIMTAMEVVGKDAFSCLAWLMDGWMDG